LLLQIEDERRHELNQGNTARRNIAEMEKQIQQLEREIRTDKNLQNVLNKEREQLDADLQEQLRLQTQLECTIRESINASENMQSMKVEFRLLDFDGRFLSPVASSSS
jgi:seryl-tRNA synthetase